MESPMGSDGRHIIHLVKGQDGRPVKMAEIPPVNIKRWVPRRKAEVVAAVRNGLITLDDACSRYALSVEEFLSWEETIHQYGPEGLQVSKMHQRHAH